MTKNQKAIKYIEKQKELNLVYLSSLKENTKGMREREYNKIRRELSEIVILLDYILIKLGGTNENWFKKKRSFNKRWHNIFN